jgi:N-acetylglucosaminyldiphosphoundecaprenol N-acetyl-beta-D-mannosaminyltransferase
MSDKSHPVSLDISGIRMLNLAMDEVIWAIEAALTASGPTRIAFVNADCVNIAAREVDYRQQLAEMDWVLVDGVGMKMAGKILGQPVRDNVNGTDMFPRLCESLARSGHSIFLLGAKPGVADAAAQWAESKYPGLRVAGVHHGYFSAEEEEPIAESIRASGASVLLVALGAPRQEKWINRHTESTGVKLAFGVGGLFDYYSGRIPRAPLWMRKMRLEWIFRLIQEPSRLWRRYLIGNFVFLLRIAKEWACSDYKRNSA